MKSEAAKSGGHVGTTGRDEETRALATNRATGEVDEKAVLDKKV